MRARLQAEWNRPKVWPLGVMALGVLLLAWIARRAFRVRERMTARGLRAAEAKA